MTAPGDTPAALKTLTTKGTVANVPVQALCTVRYEFDTSSKPDLGLRYAVAVDDRVQDAYADMPRSLKAGMRQINLRVPTGSTVSLYLNSDSHPAHRNYPVFPVQVGKSDVLVKIKERTGKEPFNPCNLGAPRQGAPLASGGRPSELYEAWLTGDVWKRISHRYSPWQVEAMLAVIDDPSVRDAVTSIYSVLPSSEIIVAFPATKAAPKHTIKVVFDPRQDNVFSNTTESLLTRDVLTRVHPMAYCALLTEARATGVTKIHVTSTWRPLMGSIAHRAGLGLDINYVEWIDKRLQLNREDLGKRNGRGKENVSAREREHLYPESQKIHAEVFALENEKDRKTVELKKARDGDRLRLQSEIAEINRRIQDARKREQELYAEWEAELDKSQSAEFKDFRERIATNASVSEVFDPWYMDGNTKDAIPFKVNTQFSKNEQMHAHHLHLTVLEPKLL